MDKQIKYQNKNYKDVNIKTSADPKSGNEIKKENPVTDWFYMTPSDTNAKMIYDLIKSKGFTEVELWEEMNVLQIELPGKKIIDFEPVVNQFKDPSDAAFIKNRNINTIFAITMDEETVEQFKAVFKIILEVWDGFLCADSTDFKPIYGMNEL